MASRLELHDELISVIGNNNVYYQPPETIKLKYPCIVYSLDGIDKFNADDKIYHHERRYTCIAIGKDPDTPIIDEMLSHFKMIRYSRRYQSDNLYHDLFELYY